jgi:RNA-directed DNA polymerase
MKKNFTNSFILYALNLPIIKDFDSLANSIGISNTMLYLLSKKTSKFYNCFNILKRNGTNREINSPKYTMKLVQRWILVEILEKIKVSNESMAFRRGINGSLQNAHHHKYSLYVLQMDLKDFFTSIRRESVFKLFKGLGYNSLVSNILTNLCTYNGFLPQGGVCSPYISNLICYKLDKRLKGLCSKRDVIYTRYADDLTFSCDNVVILRKLKKVIEEIIVDEGFIINPSKSRLLSPSGHKKVTGITINDNKIKANKKLKRDVRAMIHNALLSGDYSNKNKIRGYVSYINSIEEGYKEKIINYTNNLLEKDYKHFSDVVESFNKNKIFDKLNDMVYAEYFLMGIDDEFELKLLEEERYHFLKDRNYISESYEEALKEAGATIQEDDFEF